MKKIRRIGMLLCLLSAYIFADSEYLIRSAASFLKNFFQGKYGTRVAITSLQNHSSLPDLAISKLYQVLCSQLESDGTIQFQDLLVSFTNGRGEFNLSRTDMLAFAIELAFLQSRNKIGLGIALYSRRLDQMVASKYLETDIAENEKIFLNLHDSGFTGLGFAKMQEMSVEENLLDVATIVETGGTASYFFFFPEQISQFRAKEISLEKVLTIPLKWERPYYPSLTPEGRLLTFSQGKTQILTAGANFASYSQVLRLAGNVWQETEHLPFVPLKKLLINQSPYLIGGTYEKGRNYFSETVTLMPLSESAFSARNLMQKKVPPYYSIDFSTNQEQLSAIFFVDLSYQFHFLSANWQENPPEAEKRGGSLAMLQNRWLAISDYSRNTDRLFLYNVQDGGRKLVYTIPLDGELRFVNAGQWKNAHGFWIYLDRRQDNAHSFLLQFWGKAGE